jgi:uroporphyrinogen-III synthase
MARLIVTRPEQQALPWVKVLGEMGHEAQAFPLIEIASVDSPDDVQAVQAGWQRLPMCDALMFVSSPAVHGFFKPNEAIAGIESARDAIELIVNNYPRLRLWATGPGTVASLIALGMPQERIDGPALNAAQFDSEALWQTVRSQVAPGKHVLIVRGRDVGMPDSSRDWLAQQIIASGGIAHTLVAYERRAPKWSAAQTAQFQRWLNDGSIWLLSSSQAVRNIPSILNTRQAICICTHERIAQSARERGFAVVCTSRPTMQDVAASIKSLNDRANP